MSDPPTIVLSRNPADQPERRTPQQRRSDAREGDIAADRPTRRDPLEPTPPSGSADRPTRREDPGQGDAKREASAQAAAPDRGARRLNLPASITSEYDYLHDLPAWGGEADIALLQAKASGQRVIFKYYKTGLGPDPKAMLALRGADPAHVVRLIDFHDGPEGTWEVQEYCEPGSLRTWVAARGGRLGTEVLEAVVREIGQALSYLHGLGSGIAHRDLKPGNVLVRAQSPLDLVLADFGIAKAQQHLTQLTTTVKGTWQYAAPEVHLRESSAKSDWFSLGAMVYEFYTGRRLFTLPDGTEAGEQDARARCLAGKYSTELIDDPRWRLLADGLLTWERQHRWGAAQVRAWLHGHSPPVHVSHTHAEPRGSGVGRSRSPGYRPNWSPSLVHTPVELAEELRRHWDDAAAELTGRPDAKMIRFLEGLSGMAEAVRIVESAEAPGPKIVRLQAVLDPDGPIHYDGAPLDRATVARRARAAATGDENALGWLHAMLKERVLTAYAEVTGSRQAARMDYLLGRWRDQAEAVTRSLPPGYQNLARQAFRDALPELFAVALERSEDET